MLPSVSVNTLTLPDNNGNQAWDYTPDGLPESITTYNDGGASSVINSYLYNKRRLPIAETLQADTHTWTVGYGYDVNANLATLTYPDSLSVAYAPNALGQPTQAGTFATNVTYHPNGAIAGFTYGNGIVHTMTRNARGLPERSRDADGTTSIHDDSYDYDANGNVMAISDAVAEFRGDRDMTYDDLDRLIQVTGKEGTPSKMFGIATYAYDQFDNLTHVQVTGGSQPRNHTYCYDQFNRLTNVKSTPCSVPGSDIGLGYDVQGNLNNKNGVNYTFDYGNRLRSGGPETYRCDAHGRRVRSSSSAGLAYSFYSQSGQILFQRDERGSKRRQYIYLAGSLVAEHSRPIGSSTATSTYQHTDALGSPVATTNSAKTVLQRSEYEPYGYLANRPMQDGPGYTGHITDAATGLVYMQQRYYDPIIPRFLSVDPVTAYSAPVAMFNRYRYAASNPYTLKDPDGRCPVGLQHICGDQPQRVRFGPSGESSSKSSGVASFGTNRITISESVDGNHHEYRISGAVCRSNDKRCDNSYADEVYAHVNGNDIPFTVFDRGNGERNLIPLIPQPLGNQPIFHVENLAGRTSVNIALEGHNFFPGSVVHRVYFAKGWLRYEVIGVGSGRRPGANNKLGIILFYPGVAEVVTKFGW